MTAIARLAAIAAIACAMGIAAGEASAAGFKRGATLVEFFNFAATAGEGTAKVYANPPFPNVRPALARIDFADLLSVVAAASADNQVTAAEAKAIRARWEELKAVTEEFVSCCEAGNFRGVHKVAGLVHSAK